jgi:hypothetical protein
MRRALLIAAIALATSFVTGGARADPIRPFVGARFGPQAWYFDRFDSPSGLRGGAVAIEAGAFVTPTIGLYAFGERGFYDERDDRLPPGPIATSNAFGIGARLRTPTDGWFAFVLDLGIAYRSLSVPYDAPNDPVTREDTFSGLEWLRVRAGPTFQIENGLWADVGVGVSIGRFGATPRSPMTCAIVDGCPDSMVDDVTPSTHLLVDLVAGMHYAF